MCSERDTGRAARQLAPRHVRARSGQAIDSGCKPCPPPAVRRAGDHGRRPRRVAAASADAAVSAARPYSRRMKPSRSGHLPINGLQLYYEAHGELGAAGTVPLLLIPGAFLSTDSMQQWVAAFVAERPGLVFDRQG